jgi:hypothetical protein
MVYSASNSFYLICILFYDLSKQLLTRWQYLCLGKITTQIIVSKIRAVKLTHKFWLCKAVYFVQ